MAFHPLFNRWGHWPFHSSTHYNRPYPTGLSLSLLVIGQVFTQHGLYILLEKKLQPILKKTLNLNNPDIIAVIPEGIFEIFIDVPGALN
jgi:hypothetical protein